MAKDDKTQEPTPPVDGNPEEPAVEEIKVTKVDHRVLSSIGVNFAKFQNVDGKDVYTQSHRLVEPPEVLKYNDFGADDEERETVIARLISLGAIEPVK